MRQLITGASLHNWRWLRSRTVVLAVVLILKTLSFLRLHAATAGYSGGRTSPGSPFAECIRYNEDLARDPKCGLPDATRRTLCFYDRKVCNVRCYVYCYSADEVSIAQQIPCGQFSCEVWVPCLKHEKVMSAIGACDVPAAAPCNEALTSSGCSGRSAVIQNCASNFIGLCPSTSSQEVCCE